jgi:hypothetical protein
MGAAQPGWRHARSMAARSTIQPMARPMGQPGSEAPTGRATVERARERFIAIEFRWVGATGVQPVVLVSREWLH